MAHWWQTAVIYQIYPRSFADSDGDGVGDLAGIVEHLDYLSGTLGVDAIWISPFYPSPQADFGYDVSDYCDVDPVYGDLAGFDRLLAACHERDLRVIVDFVPNHTSDQHAWFQASRSSRDDPKRDWYVWRDARPDGAPPNNWLSNFGGSAWEWDEATGQYYLHSFLKEQPDLDWRNPEVKEAMFDVVRFWLDRGVDGIRIDVAHRIMKDPELRDNPPRPAGEKNFKEMGEYDSQIQLNNMGHADVHGVYREMRRLFDAYEPARMMVGEIHIFDRDEWASYYGNNDELHLVYDFSLLYQPFEAPTFGRLIEAQEQAVGGRGWPTHVLGNHDETRLVDRYGPGKERAAALLLLTLRGTPTIYYGDEIGMRQVAIPSDRMQDPWEQREPGLGRDGSRTPMQWSAAPHAGFSPAGTARTWLPVDDPDGTINVAAQLAEPGSLLGFYRALLAYRRTSSTLQTGDFAMVDGMPPECLVYRRRDGNGEVLVAINPTDRATEVLLPAPGRIVLGTLLDRSGPIEGDLGLRPFEGVVIEVTDSGR